jgi:hypothetical protein
MNTVTTYNTKIKYLFRNVWGNPNPETVEVKGDAGYNLYEGGHFVWSKTKKQDIAGYFCGVPFILKGELKEGFEGPEVTLQFAGGNEICIPESEKFLMLADAFVVAIGSIDWC